MSWKSTKRWHEIFAETEKEIAFMLEQISVRASGWAMERNEEEITQEAVGRLKEKQGIEYATSDTIM